MPNRQELEDYRNKHECSLQEAVRHFKREENLAELKRINGALTHGDVRQALRDLISYEIKKYQK